MPPICSFVFPANHDVQWSFESTPRVCSEITRQPWFFHFQSYSWWPNISVRMNFHWWKSWTSRRWLIAGQTSPDCIFLAGVCADQVYLVSFRTIQQAGRGHPAPLLPIFDQNYFILAKAKIFMTLRQPFTVFRVLEWTFSKCWRGVVDLKGIPNAWTQRIERGDVTNDKWQIFVWRKNLRSSF